MDGTDIKIVISFVPQRQLINLRYEIYKKKGNNSTTLK